jgi:cytochrome c biogenesis protein CcmG/thiol:disulfide interchange protein DsbE
MKLSKIENLTIVGLNYKDKTKNAKKFISDLGNPFYEILTDPDGTISIQLGAYGVPETFLINRESEILKKYIGQLTFEQILEIKKIIN